MRIAQKALKFILTTTGKSVQHELDYNNLLYFFAVVFHCYEQIINLWIELTEEMSGKLIAKCEQE